MVWTLEFGRKVYDWWGRHPRVYNLLRWTVCLGRERRLQRCAIEAIGLRHGDTVLDLGCGNGVNFPWLQIAIGSTGKILAFDYSDGMLASARKRAAGHGWRNVEFIQGEAARMNLPENSLDGAVSTFALSAMPREKEAINRVVRALKPGRQFVVFDAKLFTGAGRIWNPIVGPLFKHTFNFNHQKDVIASVKEFFETVAVSEFNSGCNFIAVTAKEATTNDLHSRELPFAAKQAAAGW